MIPHIKISGAIMAAYGLSMSLLMGGIVLLMGGVTGLLGFIGVVDDEEVLIGAVIYGILTVFVAVFTLVPPIGCLVSGVGLFLEKRWARIPAMLFGAVVLMNMPLGTMVGLYVIFVMIDKDVTAYLAGEVA